MWQHGIENKSPPAHPYTSSIKIIGKWPFSRLDLVTHPQSLYPGVQIPPQTSLYCPQLQTKPQPYLPMPKKLFLESNLLAFIDHYDNLWFLSDTFQSGLNVSMMLGRRVRSVALSENQCIISNRRNPVLLNWGAKKILDVSDCEIVKVSEKYNRGINNQFVGYVMYNSHRDDRYFYSNCKKIDNSNKLYQLKVQVGNEGEDNGTNGGNGSGLRRMKSLRKKDKNKSDVIEEETYSVIGYPTQQTFRMKNKVIGISAGKFHCLCWDSAGLLYSWGNRSLALGYDQLPREKITTRPKMVQKLPKFVTSAVAGPHYSLALTSDGNVYEWGIKKQSNEINEQLIFEPKILQVDSGTSKIIMLKGKGDQYVCLNSKHQLFIWGEKAAKFLHPETIECTNFTNHNIYEPFLVPGLQRENIVDFAIGETFIALIISNQNQFMVSEQQKLYWNDMLRRVRTKLKLANTIKTQATEIPNLNPSILRNSQSQAQQKQQELNPINLFGNMGQYKSNIEKCFQERNLKRQYFYSLKNQSKFYLNLMKSNQENFRVSDEKVTEGHLISSRRDLSKNGQSSMSRFLSQRQKDNFKKSFSDDKYKNISKKMNVSGMLELMSQIKKKNQSSQGKMINQNTNKENQKDKLMKSTMKNSNSWLAKNLKQSLLLQKPIAQKITKRSRVRSPKRTLQPYQSRLERVQQKKRSLQESFTQQISKKVQQSSIQFRSLRHQQIMQAKIHEKNRNILKQTLQAYLIKHYLARMFLSPVEEGRKIKIQQFAKSLHLSRIQKNLRCIFVRARVKHRLGKLRKCNFVVYALLCTVFKKYVKKRRQEKTKTMRKMVAQQLFKAVLKQKIKLGLSKSHLNTRKLQKFRQWLVITKMQRLRCLRVLWKNHLLSIMKITNETDAITLCKVQQNCTFESLFKQKLLANPMLKLQTFLNKSPIFQLRSQYFQSLIFLFRKDNHKKSQPITRDIKIGRRKPKLIKFCSENEALLLNPHQNGSFGSLLPYSLHYGLLVRPKSMEINIPESMKKNQSWIKQQVNILQKCLKQVLETHEKNFIKARRKYDIDLAYYIRQKYDSLAQKRWKCIIEYNLLKKTPFKAKKQKELYRLFDLIGMQKILNEDCLPEKYLMLEEAVKRRDAPVPPSPFLVFGLGEFREVFKKYYETLVVKAKYMRKSYV